MIHQVFWPFTSKDWKDIPKFRDNMLETQDFCKVHNYEYKLWDLKDCEKLIKENYSEYLDLWHNFRYPIQRCDFVRYCILHKYGGLYIDCDIRPMKALGEVFLQPIYFVYWNDDKKKLPYIAVLASQAGETLFLDVMKECRRSYNEKSKIEKYKEWKGRFIYQTTGHYMLERALKAHKIDKDEFFHDVLYVHNPDKKYRNGNNFIGDMNTALFYDANASVWYDNLI